jgi:T-complex protein 1 subunit theta
MKVLLREECRCRPARRCPGDAAEAPVAACAAQCCETITAPSEADIVRVIKPCFAAKNQGLEDFFAPLIAEACTQVMLPGSNTFNVDSVRVNKIVGGSFENSALVNGMVVPRDAEGTVKTMKDARVAVFSVEVESTATENKGTVLIESSEQLLKYNRSEEMAMEAMIKSIVDCGANVIITGSKFSEMAMHYCERSGVMMLKILSKFELRRVCKTIGATTLAKLGPVAPEELGRCSSISAETFGDTRVTVFRQDDVDSRISTLLLRGGTRNGLDDLQRSIENSVNCVKMLTTDGRLCPGGGATEIECARQLYSIGESRPGMEQYAIKKFAESLEVVPRTLAENGGQKATEVISALYAAHEAGEARAGVNISDGGVQDTVAAGVVDVLATKLSAVKLAADAAITVLRVDTIIMAKPAGGPKK